MEPLSKDERAELVRLHEVGAPEPWRAEWLDIKGAGGKSDVTVPYEGFYNQDDVALAVAARNALPRLLADLQRVEGERDALRGEAREWLCEQCNTVYPGPPQEGFACLMCPRRGGTTGPKTAVIRRKAEERAQQAERLLAHVSSDVDTLRQRLRESEGREVLLRGVLGLAKQALDHSAPASCWATGPMTGNPVEDLVVCPGCRAIKAIDALDTPPPLWDLLTRLLNALDAVEAVRLPDGYSAMTIREKGAALAIYQEQLKAAEDALQTVVAEVKGAMGR